MNAAPEIPRGLVTALRSSRHVCVLTGAGMSAESGIPTFREAQTGLWEQYDPLELATTEAFLRDPELVWRWYRWRRELVGRAAPNPGHYALSTLAERVPRLTLITQNVDGLHARAGSRDVIEFHGNLFANVCSVEGCPVDGESVDDDGVPGCPECGGLLRPGVVWFGETIPAAALEAAAGAAASCDLFFSIGTSALVWPAAGLANAARAAGAQVVEINTAETDLSASCDYRVAGKSGEVLPKLIDCLS